MGLMAGCTESAITFWDKFFFVGVKRTFFPKNCIFPPRFGKSDIFLATGAQAFPQEPHEQPHLLLGRQRSVVVAPHLLREI